MLAESGLDPLAITPTGPRGALVKGDVLAAMGLCAPPTPAAAAKPAAAASATAASAAAPPPPSPPAAEADVADVDAFQDLPVTSVRKVIAARLLESKTTNPHEFISADVSLAGVAALRAELKAAGVRASVNDCVVYAASRALAASPKVNATWDDAKVRRLKPLNHTNI